MGEHRWVPIQLLFYHLELEHPLGLKTIWKRGGDENSRRRGPTALRS